MRRKAFFSVVTLLSTLICSCQKSIKVYTVTWKNYDGTILKVDENQLEGTTPTYTGETPIKPNSEKYHYTFTSWSPAISPLKEDVTYTAVFKEEINQYTIKFVNPDGEILQEDILNYGETPSYRGTTPTYNKAGYTTTFKKWSDNIEPAVKNKKYTAIYDQEILNKELPIINIITDDKQPVTTKTEYKHSQIILSNCEEEYSLDIGANIKGRGNSSWTFDKKSYKIKFDKKVSLFGSTYKAKKWTLIANYTDKSLLRNYIAYEMNKQIGDIPFYSTHIPIEVYMNDDYLGVYLLCDQIEIGKGRVDIDNSLDAESGNNGYLIELDIRASSEGTRNVDFFVCDDKNPYTIKCPDTSSNEYLAIAGIEINYIKGYMNQCLKALKEKNWSEVEKLMDVKSFCDAYIIEELYGNNDVGICSVFYYKDKDGKLTFAPLWDFDIGGGNSCMGLGNKFTCPPDKALYASEHSSMFKSLLCFDEFKSLIKEKLISFELKFHNIMEMLNTESDKGLYTTNKEAFNRNFDRWKTMGIYIWPEPQDVVQITTVKGQIEYLKAWLEKRYQFLIKCYS